MVGVNRELASADILVKLLEGSNNSISERAVWPEAIVDTNDFEQSYSSQRYNISVFDNWYHGKSDIK